MSQKSLLITHEVPGDVQSVFAAFTEELFLALAPAFPPSKLLRYDGNQPGDLVKIQLGVPPFTQTWISEITEHVEGRETCYFVDEGKTLPFPLNYWRHKHLLEQKAQNRVVITEDIIFGTGSSLLTSIMTPLIRQQFSARGPVYTRFFSERGAKE